MSKSALGRVTRARHLLLLGLLTLLSSTLRAQAPDDGWQPIRRDEGIRSWERVRPGHQLSEFRAQTTIDASMWEALAILDDVDRACGWTSHCAEMRRIATISSQEVLVYARMDAPWPVRDRDVVVRVRVVYGGPGEVILRISAVEPAPMPAQEGVVRMPRFVAHYRFRALAADRFQAEYQLDVEPGGTLPEWLKQLVAKNLAHNTLADLRDRASWARERALYRERAASLAALAANSGYRRPNFEASSVQAAR